jgi:cysteine desulfurase/selenocysteine lyase
VFDVARIRQDFPILNQTVKGKPLIYLDNAATSQKPEIVIETLNRYYREENANIHRGVHHLSEKATDLFEGARTKVKNWIHAKESKEIIFVRGTTEAINLVAQTYGRKHLKMSEEILITTLEHHSNIVPWQILCQQNCGFLKVAPIRPSGEVILEEFEKLLHERTKLVALGHVSNALGTINPVKEMIRMAHARGIPVLLDGAQAVPHMKVDVQDLDCDFYAFSGHKVFGPTGIGILYGKADLLEAMPPYQGGGDMISMVSFEKTLYNHLPHKFEAGTPDIAGAIGLGAALDYLSSVGIEAAENYEHELLRYATESLSVIPGLKIIGTAEKKAGVISFVMDGIHPHDIGTVLDLEGIAIRTGHHCAMPLMEWYHLPATARASLAFYNIPEEIDALVKGLEKVRKIFG